MSATWSADIQIKPSFVLPFSDIMPIRIVSRQQSEKLEKNARLSSGKGRQPRPPPGMLEYHARLSKFHEGRGLRSGSSPDKVREGCDIACPWNPPWSIYMFFDKGSIPGYVPEVCCQSCTGSHITMQDELG